MSTRPPLAIAILVLLIAIALAGCSSVSNDPDGDGLPNEIEDQFGTDPNNPDTDGDGLTDFQEAVEEYYVRQGVDPLKADTDGDGLDDREEAQLYGTNPTRGDTDGDELTDLEEVTLFAEWDCKDEGDPPLCTRLRGLNATNPDTDGDQWPDAQEVPYWLARTGDDRNLTARRSDDPDVDGDGVIDGIDTDPLFDLSIRIRVVEINLTQSFDAEGGANVTLLLRAGLGERTAQVGRVSEGITQLDVSWTHDLDDTGRPTGFQVTTGVEARHDDAEGIRIAGPDPLVVRTLPASDYAFSGTGQQTTTGEHGSLTFSVTLCRDGC